MINSCSDWLKPDKKKKVIYEKMKMDITQSASQFCAVLAETENILSNNRFCEIFVLIYSMSLTILS